MKQERYRPSREEVANAEQSMTEEQEALSLGRAKEVKQRELEALESRFLGTLKTGERVFDIERSHIHSGETLKKYLPDALSSLENTGKDFMVTSVDFKEHIGTSSCVETHEGDEIVYAQRVGRAGLTRFVKNRDVAPTTHVTVVLKSIPEGFILLTAYFGETSEVEPWDARATDTSRRFWSTHALVWGSEPVIPGTESTDAP